MARTSYYAEVLTTTLTATVAYATAADLAHTPAANANILYIWSLDAAASSANQYLETRLQHITDATTLSEQIQQHEVAAPGVTKTPSGFRIYSYGATPGANTVSLEVRSAAAGASFERANARLWGIELAANDAFSNGPDAWTAVTGAWTTVSGADLTLSVAVSGGYVLLAQAEVTSALGAGALFRLNVDSSVLSTFHVPIANAARPSITYATRQALAAGSHTIKLQAIPNDYSSSVSIGVRRGRVVALEEAGFAYSYTHYSTSGASTGHHVYATATSFTPNITETKRHLILSYYQNQSVSGASLNQQTFTRLLNNSDIKNQTNVRNPLTSAAGRWSEIALIPVQATVTTGTENNWSFLVKASASANPITLGHSFISILQLDDASAAGGGTTTLSTLSGVALAQPSIIKLVGKPVESVTTGQPDVAKGRFSTLSGVASAIAQLVQGRFQLLAGLSSGITQAVKSVGKPLQGTGSGQVQTVKSVGKPLSGTGTAIGQTAIGRFLTLSAVGQGIGAISSALVLLISMAATAIGIVDLRKTVGKMMGASALGIGLITKAVFKPLQSVGSGAADAVRMVLKPLAASGLGAAALNAAPTFIQTLTAVGRGVASLSASVIVALIEVQLIAVAQAIADMTRTVFKPLQSIGNAVAALGNGAIFMRSLSALGNGIASLTSVFEAAAPDGPYTLNLGNSVKRFVSTIKHRALGKGTVSDRDPA